MTLSPEHSMNPCDDDTGEISGKQVMGNIHSIETCGTVDGPGVRFVIFTQGCPMRCLYCHNPDTWDPKKGTQMSVESLLQQYEAGRFYYREGGITVTGGEPMLQMEFLTTLFEEAKKRDIHTCLDTSGVCIHEENPSFMKWMNRLVKATDLVLLDIKHIEDAAHQKLTGKSNQNILAFARYLDAHNVDMWIRHVVVEGYTDDPEDLQALGSYIGMLKSVKAVDVLPYHTLGKSKYKALGLHYPLENLSDLPGEKLTRAKSEIIKGIRNSDLKNEYFQQLP